MARSLMRPQGVSNSGDFVGDKEIRFAISTGCSASNVADGLLHLTRDLANVAVRATHVAGEPSHDDARSRLFSGEFVKRLAQIFDLSAWRRGTECSDIGSPFFEAIGNHSDDNTRRILLPKIARSVFEDIGHRGSNSISAFGDEQTRKALDSEPVGNALGAEFLSKSRGAIQLGAQLHDLNIETVHVNTLSSVCGNTTIAGRASAASRRPKASFLMREAA